jgi:hypothetical protein
MDEPDRGRTEGRDSDSPTVVQTHFWIGKYWGLVFLLLQTATELDFEPGLKPGVEPGVKHGSGFLGR